MNKLWILFFGIISILWFNKHFIVRILSYELWILPMLWFNNIWTSFKYYFLEYKHSIVRIFSYELWILSMLWSNNIWTSFEYYFLEYCQYCDPINILLWEYFYMNKLWILFFGILSMLWSNKHFIVRILSYELWILSMLWSNNIWTSFEYYFLEYC